MTATGRPAPDTPRSPVVDVRGVSKRFGADGGGAPTTTALRAVTMRADAGEMVLLAGPSGSGKTTLLTVMAGLVAPSEGSVSLFGRALSDHGPGDLQRLRATRMGFVFQTFLLLDGLTALENVALVLGFSGSSRADARRRAQECLAEQGVERLARRHPATMSPGERQRVALARALANEPALVLCDEPTASLESAEGMLVIEALRRYARERDGCVVVASHDLRLARAADRVLRLRDGAVVP